MHRFRWRMTAVAGALALTAGGLAMSSSLPGGASKTPGPAGAVAASTRRMTATPHRTTGVSSPKPFAATKAQQARQAALLAQKRALKAPASPKHTTSANVDASNPGPETAVAPNAPGDFKLYKQSQ